MESPSQNLMSEIENISDHSLLREQVKQYIDIFKSNGIMLNDSMLYDFCWKIDYPSINEENLEVLMQIIDDNSITTHGLKSLLYKITADDEFGFAITSKTFPLLISKLKNNEIDCDCIDFMIALSQKNIITNDNLYMLLQKINMFTLDNNFRNMINENFGIDLKQHDYLEKLSWSIRLNKARANLAALEQEQKLNPPTTIVQPSL